MVMRRHRSSFLIALLLFVAVVAGAIEKEPASVFEARREKVRRLTNGGVLVLFGFTGREPQSDGPVARFWQEPNFYYLTGWNEPGALFGMPLEMGSGA